MDQSKLILMSWAMARGRASTISTRFTQRDFLSSLRIGECDTVAPPIFFHFTKYCT